MFGGFIVWCLISYILLVGFGFGVVVVWGNQLLIYRSCCVGVGVFFLVESFWVRKAFVCTCVCKTTVGPTVVEQEKG